MEHMSTLFGHHWYLNGIRKPLLRRLDEEAPESGTNSKGEVEEQEKLDHVDKR